MSILIIGSGNVALSFYVYLMLRKVNVNLYFDEEHPGFFRLHKEKIVTVTGKLQGDVSLDHISSRLKGLIRDCNVIIVAAPTSSYEEIYKKIANHVTNQHTIFNITGNFSGLFVKKYVAKASPIIVDVSTSPFACRAYPNKGIKILGIKQRVYCAAADEENTATAIELVQSFFPSRLTPCKDFIETGLCNVNAIFHPTILALNAGMIGQSNASFDLYRMGVSPQVAQVMEALDVERCSLGDKLGYVLEPYVKVHENFYGETFTTIYDIFKNSSVFTRLKSIITNFDVRFVSEDVPYILVGWQSLAHTAGIKLETTNSIIHLLSLMTKKNYQEIDRLFSKTGSVLN